MRSIVIDATKSEGLKLEEKPFTLEELLGAQEVFVCSTSRTIVCGASVDGHSK